jgi:hypothetical protein
MASNNVAPFEADLEFKTFKGRIISDVEHKPQSRFWLWAFFSGSWLENGFSANARDQLQSEQGNVALVSALFSTISIPALLDTTSLPSAGWVDWQIGVYGLLLHLANAGLILSVLCAVFLLLAINECADQGQLQE